MHWLPAGDGVKVAEGSQPMVACMHVYVFACERALGRVLPPVEGAEHGSSVLRVPPDRGLGASNLGASESLSPECTAANPE